MTRPQDIRDAFIHVANCNHYLVKVDTADLSWDDLCAAEKLLITEENLRPGDVVSLALDLCEIAIKGAA